MSAAGREEEGCIERFEVDGVEAVVRADIRKQVAGGAGYGGYGGGGGGNGTAWGGGATQYGGGGGGGSNNWATWTNGGNGYSGFISLTW